jgi:dTMP kinase
MTKRGAFITFEGGEGTGKSTQVKRLAEKLKARSIACIVTREPGGSSGAEEIRQLLVKGEPGRWDVLTETLLLYAARADHTETTIKPALAKGQWVLCDRYSDSSYAYQGAGRGLDRETVRRIETIAIGDFKPDFTLILDMPPEVGLARAKGRGNLETRFEEFDIKFHTRLRKAFLDIARRAPERCRVIDASGEVDKVAEAILDAVKVRFRLR